MPGTKSKQADALRLNVRHLVQTFGVERIGFLTLTVGDWMQGPMQPGQKRPFIPLCDRPEAEKRFHRAMQHIRKRYQCGVTVTERTDNDGIHWHLVVVVGADIRSGIDFAAIARCDYRSAPDRLRLEWKWWRENGERWKLGRHEMLPCKVNGDAIGAYVGKYVGKGWNARAPGDKGHRSVRYFGFKPPYGVRICRCTARAGAWREACRQVAILCKLHGVEVTQENIRSFKGAKWAWHLTRMLRGVQFFVPGKLHPLFREGLQLHNTEAGERLPIWETNLDHWLPSPVRDHFTRTEQKQWQRTLDTMTLPTTDEIAS